VFFQGGTNVRFGSYIWSCFGALSATVLVVSSSHADATASAKKKSSSSTSKKSSSQTKIVRNKQLLTTLKGHPGRTPVPVASEGDFAPSGYSVKMKSRSVASTKSKPISKSASKSVAKSKSKSANETPATRATAAVPTLRAVPRSNEPVSAFVRSIRAGSPTPLAMGQALAVNENYIVTSADFVTDTWTNSGDVKFYVADSTQPLMLVAFDLGSNLAIFSAGVGARMERTLSLGRLRFEAPTAGEDYTALGLSGLIGGVRRVRPVQDLTFVRERFELPASVALAGGTPGTQFLFDKAGRWVGNVSLLDQRDGRRFDATSANQAYEMIRAVEQRPLQALPSSVLHQQAVSWQERWTNTFFEAAKKNVALRQLVCEAEALRVDDQKIASELGRTRLVHCKNAMPVALTRDYSMGVELVTGDVSYTNDVKTYLAADTSSTTAFAAASRAPASVNVMTGYECSKSDVVNSRNHHLQVRFCTSALKNVTGLNDTTITVISSDTGVKSTLHSLRLRGFEPKNAKRFMEWMIETETIQ
jgi:hypothetical protein